MRFNGFRRCALFGFIVLTCFGCSGSKEAAPVAAPPTEAARADVVLGIPAGWSDANNKSAEHYRAGNYAEAIAVLEAFAQAHPTFPDVELMIGDTWLTMPAQSGTPEAERLEKAATHLRRGLELATDDYGREWAKSSMLRVAEKKDAGAQPKTDATTRQNSQSASNTTP
jgi:hypothetical protein